MKFLYSFVTIILFLPLLGLSLYTIFYPRESALWGKRWQFKNENLEPSEEFIKHNKTGGIIALILEIILLVSTIFKICCKNIV